MGLFGNSSDPTVEMEKIKLGTTFSLMRIIDWETGVILYTETTRDGYTSVPFEETTISRSDAPQEVKEYLGREASTDS